MASRLRPFLRMKNLIKSEFDIFCQLINKVVIVMCINILVGNYIIVKIVVGKWMRRP